MPDQPPLSWTICDIDPGSSYRIVGGGFLEDAELTVRWHFEPLSDRKTRLTQRMELTGENATVYVEAISEAFGPNL